MTKHEILYTRYGEMLDMISCLAIENGAKPKKPKMSFIDFMKLK